MGELADKIKQLLKGGFFNLHGNVLAIKHDAVFIVIHIGRILEAPLAVIDPDRDHTVVIAGRMVSPSCISHIFHAQLAFGITALFCLSCCCNGLWILFRL